ncbi:MAG: hypothetical protein Q4E89_06445 [Eubacteriales bacterium]|nr:hypothetical protein [Eubacteriales bacterium]
MSQKKVDAYKAQKANRKQIIKKEKRMLTLEKTAAALVCVAVIGWIGYSTYGRLTAEDTQTQSAVEQTEVDMTAVNDYLSDLTLAAAQE